MHPPVPMHVPLLLPARFTSPENPPPLTPEPLHHPSTLPDHLSKLPPDLLRPQEPLLLLSPAPQTRIGSSNPQFFVGVDFSFERSAPPIFPPSLSAIILFVPHFLCNPSAHPLLGFPPRLSNDLPPPPPIHVYPDPAPFPSAQSISTQRCGYHLLFHHFSEPNVRTLPIPPVPPQISLALIVLHPKAFSL